MRSKYDVPHENECKECHGTGYTMHGEPRIVEINGKVKTTELGYGCLRCLGVGRVQPD